MSALPGVGDRVQHVDGTVGVIVSVNAHLPLGKMVRDADGGHYEFDLRKSTIYGGQAVARQAPSSASPPGEPRETRRAKPPSPAAIAAAATDGRPVVRHLPAGAPPPEPVRRWMEDPLLAWMYSPGVDIDACHREKL